MTSESRFQIWGHQRLGWQRWREAWIGLEASLGFNPRFNESRKISSYSLTASLAKVILLPLYLFLNPFLLGSPPNYRINAEEEQHFGEPLVIANYRVTSEEELVELVSETDDGANYRVTSEEKLVSETDDGAKYRVTSEEEVEELVSETDYGANCRVTSEEELVSETDDGANYCVTSEEKLVSETNDGANYRVPGRLMDAVVVTRGREAYDVEAFIRT